MLLGVVVFSVVGIGAAIRTGDPRWIFLSLPFTVLLFVVGRYAPVAFHLDADGLRVERRARDVVIPYRAIRAVDVTPRPVRGMTMLGSRGVFGVYGRFWNGTLGFYRLYLTNTRAVVWLDTEQGWVGLSPDRPDDFVARLGSRLGRSPR